MPTLTPHVKPMSSRLICEHNTTTTTTTTDDDIIINAAPILDLIWEVTLIRIEDVNIHYLLLVSKVVIAVNLKDLHHYHRYKPTTIFSV